MKSGVFSQLLIHIVFSPYNREALLRKSQREELYSYMSGTITQKKHKSLIINGMPDHTHILIGLNPAMSISDLVRDIKRSSSIFINEKKWFAGNFNWQEGYGVFSYSRSQLDDIYKYIQNQEEHHKKVSFREEYLGILKTFDVEYDERFLFKFFD